MPACSWKFKVYGSVHSWLSFGCLESDPVSPWFWKLCKNVLILTVSKWVSAQPRETIRHASLVSIFSEFTGSVRPLSSPYLEFISYSTCPYNQLAYNFPSFLYLWDAKDYMATTCVFLCPAGFIIKHVVEDKFIQNLMNSNCEILKPPRQCPL